MFGILHFNMVPVSLAWWSGAAPGVVMKLHLAQHDGSCSLTVTAPASESELAHETLFVSKVHWMLDPLTNHRRPIIQKHKIATRPWALGHWERVGPLAPKLFTAA